MLDTAKHNAAESKGAMPGSEHGEAEQARDQAASTPRSEEDRLNYLDIVVARSIDAVVLTEASLLLARQEIGNGTFAILFGDLEALQALSPGTHGLDRVVPLIATVGGHRQLCLAVGFPTKTLTFDAVAKFGQPAIFCDDDGTVLVHADGHTEALGPCDPRTITGALSRCFGAEVHFDLPPQGWAQSMIEQHCRPEALTDEQRDALLAKLARLTSRAQQQRKECP